MDASIDFSGVLKGSIADGGDEVIITPVVTSGTKIADVSIGGVEKDLYCPTPPAPTEVDITPVVTSGTKIADVSIGGVEKDLYTPDYETDITEIKQSLSNLVKSTIVRGTTTSTGALAIPNELKSKPLIDLHYDSANGLVFRRDNDYLTCLALSLQPFSKTSVSITVWYLDV